jgi:subfamily B ATP-binding cassette protein MsbA
VFLLYDPFKKLSRVHAQVQLGLAGAQRIFEILDTKPKIVDPVTPISLTDSHEIVFSDVVFTYPGAENPALKGVSLRVEEGKKTALVGLSGSGKSTLVDLIPRFIAPKSGTVSLGGIDISSVKLTDLRARLSLVGQHTFLFNDTISNNIRYGNLAASHEEIIAAAKSAFALDFIERLPLGFETVIGEGGHALSGGERQRLAIARAILKDAPILIMDEATASLDNRSEREVQGALESLERNRTTIVVAHRLSTIQNADKIIVMQGGFVVEQGTHADLLKQGGEYYRLYKLGNSEAA